jgi:hypothetical protein
MENPFPETMFLSRSQEREWIGKIQPMLRAFVGLNLLYFACSNRILRVVGGVDAPKFDSAPKL